MEKYDCKTIAVLVTVHNRKNETLKGLSSLFAAISSSHGNIYEVFLTDDGSTDGTSEAVKKLFPNVNVIEGDGNLFWSRGMNLAWEKASMKDYDYYIWWNDDTILYEDALVELLATHKQIGDNSIVSGLIEDSNHCVSYGGCDVDRKFIIPNGMPQPITYMNGNFVLIPRIVFKEIGYIDKYFHHGKGDYDYGLMSLKHGIKVVSTRKYIGSCERHDKPCNPIFDATLPLKRRIELSHSPFYSKKIDFYYTKKHWGLATALTNYVISTIYIYFPIFYKIAEILKKGKILFYFKELVERYYIAISKFLHRNNFGYILMYHDINNEGEQTSCKHSIDTFRSHIEYFLKNGYEFVKLSECINRKITDKHKIVTITFDDAFDSVYKNAYPILKEYKIPFTIFQTSEFVNKPGYLSEIQIRDMLDSGLCTLGAHTRSHKMLSAISIQEQEAEIVKGKTDLENQFGVKVDYFAYPFGRMHSVAKTSIEIARKHFKASFMATPLGLNLATVEDRYKMPRIVPFYNYNSFN